MASAGPCASLHLALQITMPTPHHSVFLQMPFLLPNQHSQSTEGKNKQYKNVNSNEMPMTTWTCKLVMSDFSAAFWSCSTMASHWKQPVTLSEWQCTRLATKPRTMKSSFSYNIKKSSKCNSYKTYTTENHTSTAQLLRIHLTQTNSDTF